MLRVVVAAFGPSFLYEQGLWTGPRLADQGPDVRYADRLKVELAVDSAETLGAVIDRAAQSFGVGAGEPFGGAPLSEVITGVVFYKPEDEETFIRPEPWPSVTRLVDGQGRPSWAVPWRVVEYHELLEAAEAGLVDGDPLRPYLWAVIPQGDLLGVTLHDALWALEQALKGALAYGGGRALKLAYDRVKGFWRVSEPGSEEQSRWRQRLARPDDLRTFLDAPRTTAEVAQALDCPSFEAEAALWALGYALDEDGSLWRKAADEPSAIIDSALERARTTGVRPGLETTDRDLEGEASE